MGTGGPCAVKTPTFSFIRLLSVSFSLAILADWVGIDLFSRHASVQVSSAQHSLTSVFGMGTGGPCALKTPTVGAPPGTRTPDPLIKSQLLYQLS